MSENKKAVSRHLTRDITGNTYNAGAVKGYYEARLFMI